MGKTAGTKLYQTKSKGVVKQAALQKPIHSVPFKRLLMLQRRICSLVDEKSSWAEKNKNLSDSLKAEKLMNATLRKESYHWQRLYHEAMITINSYKVKQAEIAQVLSPCLREIDSIYPLMVGFSEAITSNKIRISGLLNSLPSEYECLPMHCKEGGRASDLNKKSGKPMKQRVGPMVRGMLITKPKIMLERVILPQPQDQDLRNVEIEEPSEVNNHLTPIQEENEHEPESLLRNVSMRQKRSKLGTSWKTKIKEKNDIQLGKVRDISEVVGISGIGEAEYNEDSSDAESNPATVDPVVRFKDVSRLLQKSSLMKLDGNRPGHGGSDPLIQPEPKPKKMNGRPADDPLEGSSWMYPNNLRNTFRPTQKRSSLYKSESSDDEEELLVAQNVSNISTMDTLVMKNQTFFVAKNSPDSFLPDTDKDSINGSQPAEPDSTNNVDAQLSDHLSSIINSINSSSCSAIFNKSSVQSSSTSDNHNSTNTSASSSVSNNVLKVSLSNLNSRPSSTHNSLLEKGGSNVRNSLVITELILPQVPQKRLRKPKCHLYPGEDDTGSLPRRLSSSGRKSIESNKAKKVVSVKQRISIGKGKTKNGLKKSEHSQGAPDKILKNKKESTADLRIEKISTKRSSELKKSIHTPRTSSFGSLIENGDASRPKRAKPNICYKESPLNMKQRRP